MTYTITIPDVPPSLNALPRHWAAKRDLRHNWILYVRSALPAGKRKATVKMRCTVTLHHARMYDADNAYGACKILLDALRNRKVIVDDTAEWLDLSVEQAQCSHRDRHTTIELESME